MTEPRAAALRAVVRGRVQGVNFRDYVLTRARFLRLAGCVRNLPGGRSVEVVAEGPRPDLERLVEYLHQGPRMSRVDAVDVEWGEASGGYSHFGVAY
jgi:acylphosphatase